MTYTALKYLGRVEPATVQKAEEVLAALEKATGRKLSHTWGKGSSSEHATGRAVDFMVFRDKAAGDFIANYIWQHRERLQLQHIIWYQRIISVDESPGVWRLMGNRGNDTENHKDHPHVLFKPGPYVPLVVRGRGPIGPLTVDGKLGASTILALQKALNVWRKDGTPKLKEDGLIEEPSETISQLQWQIGADRDGEFGPQSARALEAWLDVKAETIPGWYPGLIRALQRRLNVEIEKGVIK